MRLSWMAISMSRCGHEPWLCCELPVLHNLIRPRGMSPFCGRRGCRAKCGPGPAASMRPVPWELRCCDVADVFAASITANLEVSSIGTMSTLCWNIQFHRNLSCRRTTSPISRGSIVCAIVPPDLRRRTLLDSMAIQPSRGFQCARYRDAARRGRVWFTRPRSCLASGRCCPCSSRMWFISIGKCEFARPSVSCRSISYAKRTRKVISRIARIRSKPSPRLYAEISMPNLVAPMSLFSIVPRRPQCGRRAARMRALSMLTSEEAS